MNPKHSFILIILLGLNIQSIAQSFRNSIIKDINTNNYNADIKDYIDLNGEIYFINSETNNENYNFYNQEVIFKIWKFDQNTYQPILIKEFNIQFSSAYVKIHKTNSNYFYIEVHNSNFEIEIWYCDGTTQNTMKVVSGFRKVLQVINSTLYLLDDNFTNLYKYNFGSSPQLVTTTSSGLDYCSNCVSNNKLFYITNSNSLNYLSSIDLNNQIQTLFSSPSFYNIYIIGKVNNKIIFYGYDQSTKSDKLFSTDGTLAGTTPFYNFPSSPGSPKGFSSINKLYFFTYQGLMVTDGTTNNTNIIDFAGVVPLFSESNPSVGDIFLYKKNVYNNSEYHAELWSTDGISKFKLKDTIPYFTPFPDYGKLVTNEGNNFKYYALSTNTIYKYDLINSNISKLNIDFTDRIYNLKGISDGVLFEGTLQNSTIGSELYLYQNNSLSLIKDFNQNTLGSISGDINIIDDYILYETNDNKVVVSKGLKENTFELPVFSPFSNILNLNPPIRKTDGVYLIFSFSKSHEIDLNSKTVRTLAPYPDDLNMTKNNISSYYDNVLIWGDKKLYKYNVNNNSFALVKNFSNSYIFYKKNILYKNKYYFVMEDSYNTFLWVTDGTSNGTNLVYTWNFRDFGDVNIINDMLVFFFYPSKLWKSNGTANGTAQLAQFPTNYFYSYGAENLGSNYVFSDSLNFYKSVVDQNGSRSFYRTNQSLTGIELLASHPNQISNSKAYCKCNGNIYSFTNDNKLWEYNPNNNTVNLKYDFKYYNALEFNTIIGNPICNSGFLWLSMAKSTGGWRLASLNINDNTVNWFDDAYLLDLAACCSRIFKSNMVIYKNSVLYPKIDKKYGTEVFKVGPCENGNNRQGNSITGDYYHTNAVESTEKITFPIAVNLFSNNSITLLPGFEVKQSSYFYSAIKECK